MAAEVLKLMGRAVSFGHAAGPAFILRKRLPVVREFTISEGQIPREWARFEKACEEAERQLIECKDRLGDAELGRGEIFDIQIALLKDSYILHELKQALAHTLKNVEACLVRVIDTCVQQFQNRDALAQEHCVDLQDVCKRLLRILMEGGGCEKNFCTKGSICVADSLEPSDVIALKEASVAGILLECDCETSHAIILAKSLHIPILIGVKDISQIKDGTMLEIDSKNGVCWINKEKTEVFPKVDLTIPEKVSLGEQEVRFYLTYDGCTSSLLKKSIVSGIGLVRSEMLFIDRENFPTEEEQFLFYKRIVESANGKPVVLRTLDIGGDKLPNDQFVRELNPFLGLRGIRYSLKHEDLFRWQLLAMLRASAFGCVKVLYPMISDVGELVRANQILEECKQFLLVKKIPFDPDIEVGAMIETPSAVFCMDSFAKYCDFFSVGTNDLIQYTLAVDRTNSAVAHLYQMTHPAILRSLQLVIQQANRLGKEVLICGELPNAIVPFLMCLGLGYRYFVVYESHVSYWAHLCNKIDLADLEVFVSEAQGASSVENVFSVFEKYYKNFLNETKIF